MGSSHPDHFFALKGKKNEAVRLRFIRRKACFISPMLHAPKARFILHRQPMKRLRMRSVMKRLRHEAFPLRSNMMGEWKNENRKRT